MDGLLDLVSYVALTLLLDWRMVKDKQHEYDNWIVNFCALLAYCFFLVLPQHRGPNVGGISHGAVLVYDVMTVIVVVSKTISGCL